MRKLTYLVAQTIDGYIAGPDNDDPSPWFVLEGDHAEPLRDEFPDMHPMHVRPMLGLENTPNKHFDTVLQGRGSYEIGLRHGITNAYRHLRSIVFSTTMTQSPDPTVELVRTDPVATVRALKQDEGRDIWLCGGGRLAATLRDEIDRLIVKLQPIVAGDGIPLFHGAGFRPERYDLTDVRHFGSGVAVLTYDKRATVSSN